MSNFPCIQVKNHRRTSTISTKSHRRIRYLRKGPKSLNALKILKLIIILKNVLNKSDLVFLLCEQKQIEVQKVHLLVDPVLKSSVIFMFS